MAKIIHRNLADWGDFFKPQAIPILQASKMILLSMEEGGIENVSPKDLVRVVVGDPFLAVKLLLASEEHRSLKLERESETPLGTIMQMGLIRVLELASESGIVDSMQRGTIECAYQSVTASYLARRWAFSMADTSLDEVALAALLSDIGELLLWSFAEEVPLRAIVLTKLNPGLDLRIAQQKAGGVAFHELSIALAETWGFPPFIVSLIRGDDSLRSHIVRLAAKTAKHLFENHENPAVIDDMDELKQLLPGLDMDTLLAPIPTSSEFKELITSEIGKRNHVGLGGLAE